MNLTKVTRVFIVFGLSVSLYAQTCDVSNYQPTDYDYTMRAHETQRLTATESFVLAISWSKGFCKYQKQKISSVLNNPTSSQEDKEYSLKKKADLKVQCYSNNDFGWVVHGLWGQNYDDGHPKFCDTNAGQIDFSVIKENLCMSPSAGLIQREWEKHGTCDFNTAKQYYSQTKSLYEKFNYPSEIGDKVKAKKWLVANNISLTEKNVKVSKNDIFICFDDKLKLTTCE